MLFLLLMFFQTPSYATGIEVQPTMISRSSAQDRVWVGTFQLVWNDFIDKIVHNPIRFREGTPLMVQALNQKMFTERDLSEDSYYTFTGKVTKKTKKQIQKAIKKKFKETSDLLDKLDLTPRNDMLIVYAMLKKDFEFKNEFEKLGKDLFGNEQTAEYFGLNKSSNENLRSGVSVLFYNSPRDFAVKLATKDKDEVILYKNSTNKAFAHIYIDMLKKGRVYKGNKTFTKSDDLKIPNIKFFEEKAFEAFAKGYMSEMKEALTEEEIRLLPLSVKLMTYECGIRFLTDYLNGDTYFKIHREHHNLDRARNQFKQVADITAKEEKIAEIIKGM